MTDRDYGIVANVIEPDRELRTGAKAWLAGGTGGEGWSRFQWKGLRHKGRPIQKWAPTWRFGNFRAAWVPAHLQDRVYYMRGTREEMEKRATELNEFAESERKAHPNRQTGRAAEQKEDGNEKPIRV